MSGQVQVTRAHVFRRKQHHKLGHHFYGQVSVAPLPKTSTFSGSPQVLMFPFHFNVQEISFETEYKKKKMFAFRTFLHRILWIRTSGTLLYFINKFMKKLAVIPLQFCQASYFKLIYRTKVMYISCCYCYCCCCCCCCRMEIVQ